MIVNHGHSSKQTANDESKDEPSIESDAVPLIRIEDPIGFFPAFFADQVETLT